jgi:hypothetical protein
MTGSYAEEPEPPDQWPQTYDQMPQEPLPFARGTFWSIRNDLLLRPASVETHRAGDACPWLASAAHRRIDPFGFERDSSGAIAGKITMLPRRADFTHGCFAGLFVTGCDDLVDFNCQSAKEEKCVSPPIARSI